MSTKYPGGIITKNYTAPTPTSASGIWTLDQQEQAQKAGIWPYGGPFNYIEDVFSTWLYTGTAANQTITNNIDLSTYGGLVWTKRRNVSASHKLIDSARGWTVGSGSGRASPCLRTDASGAQAADTSGTGGPYDITSVSTTGYSIGPDWNGNGNTNTGTYASWSFRKQAKFFDVVTYTGNGANRTIAHNLGSTPGCIIVKAYTGGSASWYVYHRSLNSASYTINLDATAAQFSDSTVFNGTAPTSTVFSIGTNTDVNTSGTLYVAYLFAHNAGGFGTSNTDNVISCGSFSHPGTGGNVSVDLGYEPQWILYKRSDGVQDWFIQDIMRRDSVNADNSGLAAMLYPDLSDAEGNSSRPCYPTSTGFNASNLVGGTYIYIAIRRGPMKVPTVGTTVFSATSTTSSSNPLTITTNFPVDLTINRQIDVTYDNYLVDRLRGSSTSAVKYLISDTTAIEVSGSGFGFGLDNNTGIIDNSFISGSANKKIYWNFRRAPSFFDEVCFTGTGATRTVTHNLGVAPEMMIVKERASFARNWAVYHTGIGNTGAAYLQTTGATVTSSTFWNNTSPTSSVFTVDTASSTNESAQTYVAYLFATCAGVSKVGSYSGTGATQTIDCGFTGGARFVLIKRTDTTGDWYVWDTARGMVAGTDPYALLNSTAAEVNANNVYTTGVGFQIVGTGAGINASGGTYIYLAIA